MGWWYIYKTCNIYFFIYLLVSYVYFIYIYIYYFIFYLSHSYCGAEPPVKCVDSTKENSMAWTWTTVSQIEIFFIFCPDLSSLLPPVACFQSCATPRLPAHLFIEPRDKLNWRVGLDWKQLQQKKSLPSPHREWLAKRLHVWQGEDELMPHKMVFLLK